MPVYAVEGTIEDITTKPITIKTGPRAGGTSNIHYIHVSGQPYNVGFKHSHEIGERVTLAAEEAYGELRIVNKPIDTTAKEVPAPTKAPANRGAFPVEPTNHATSICRQSALNRATDTLAILSEAGSTDIDAMSWEEMVDLTIAIAYRYADFSTGQREVKMASLEQDEE